MGPFPNTTIAIGIDIGSTTVKAVVCDPDTLDILWSDYQRHETRQPEKTLEFLVRIGNAFPDAKDIKIFCTGSGSSPLAEPTGARFVQEVNAVTMAVEKLHPDVGSVIELGGQDAKIIIFREREDEDSAGFRVGRRLHRGVCKRSHSRSHRKAFAERLASSSEVGSAGGLRARPGPVVPLKME